MKKKEFVQYLRETLIPDLMESGRTATATDFEVACRFMELQDDVVEEVPYEDANLPAYINAWKQR